MSNEGFISDFEKEFAEELAASGLPTREYPVGPLDEANALRGTSSVPVSISGSPPFSTFGPVGLAYPPYNLYYAATPLPFAGPAPAPTPVAASPPLQPQPHDSAASAPPAIRPRSQRTTMLTHPPEVREIPWRRGQDASNNKMRVAQLYAMELVVKGDVAPVACDQCAAGQGKFSLCVVRAGEIGGACASCKFKEKNLHCSLYTG